MAPQPIDPAELGRLLDRHGAALTLYARQWTDAAEDCVQDALVELAAQPEAPANAAAWLYRVVRHRALNDARGERRRKEREQRVAKGTSGRGQPMDLAERAALGELLDRLEEAERQIVVLRIWGELNWDEVAEVVGLPRTTAQRRYIAALSMLRTAWQESPALRERGERTLVRKRDHDD